jgi:O-methyltransferase
MASLTAKIKKFGQRFLIGYHWRGERFRSLGFTTLPREKIIWEGMEYLTYNKIFGDYAEFGVCEGKTFGTAYHFFDQTKDKFPEIKKMTFHAFDSFEGFQELKGNDRGSIFVAGGRAASTEVFYETMKKMKVPNDRIKTHNGWFSETLKNNGMADQIIKDASLSFAYVDCDLFESTKDALPFLEKKLLPGAMVAFDNWFCFGAHPEKGEQGALNEFLNTRPKIKMNPFGRFGWHGFAFIYNKLEK